MSMHNPPHPGEFIREVYLDPHEISVRSLAESLDVSPSTLTRIVNGQSGLSPEMALRLSKAIGRSPESWLAMQHNYDLWQAKLSADLQDARKENETLKQSVSELDSLKRQTQNADAAQSELTFKINSLQ